MTLTHLILALTLNIPHAGLVTDRVPILTPGERQSLEVTLRDYEKVTANEVAILIVPSLGEHDIKEFAEAVFREWGIGKKAHDNGILLLWSTGDRRVRIEVGYGLEGSLPDGTAGAILRDVITPHFKRSEWYLGLQAGVGAIMAKLEKPIPSTTPSSDGAGWAIFLFAVSFIGGVYWLAWYAIRKENQHREADRVASEKAMESYRVARAVRPTFVPQSEARKVLAPPLTHSVTPPRKRAPEPPPSTYVPVPVETYSHQPVPTSWGSEISTPSSTPSSFDFGGGSSGGGGADSSY